MTRKRVLEIKWILQRKNTDLITEITNKKQYKCSLDLLRA